jgi:hypothetical protein
MQLLPQGIEQGCARLDCDRARMPIDDGGHEHSRRRQVGRISGKRRRTGHCHATRDERGPFDELTSVNGHSQCPRVIKAVVRGDCVAGCGERMRGNLHKR